MDDRNMMGKESYVRHGRRRTARAAAFLVFCAVIISFCVSGGQAASGYGVSIDEAQPGDIVSYGYNGYVSHSALYIGNGMIVHASTPELGIRVDSMYIMPIITIRRIG